MQNSYLESIKKQITYYKSLGDKTFNQLAQEELFYQYNQESNSIAVIAKHIAGNMLSRWTNFFTEDGEKSWRNRDDEFVNTFSTKEEMITYWEKGWNCFLNTINSLKETDLEKIIYIRNQGHTVIEAINRQICHYPYHIGQIVFLGKMLQNEKWESLSIPKNASKNFNQEKFSQEKSRKHFTDDL
ncbi:hypothetical protein CSC81_04165 [Tenacibaculum discolor]|uniref:DUF1572 family protein n=1 Tax=Tenacibaculum discolor TaxID=361581 RepID=A0A2G1BXG1_9FLAO|nr:DUF1572 family protein [Tenacibaculum discolor]MDP2540741.1 DUF1572 family protein [Tenacibaculum discolor]PHN98696.1 hypothetical protein CSC81_04165 [Tenacibaculum discolor]PHO00823.1 hypothetical protein CSC82_26810 [Rhodobacteraceae bacterium 4F10]